MLDKTLRDLIHRDGSQAGAGRGLLLQYRHGDDCEEPSRLLVYRRGEVAPLQAEYDMVLRALGAVIDREIEVGREELCYLASDGEMRRGRVFSWGNVAIQERLFYET